MNPRHLFTQHAHRRAFAGDRRDFLRTASAATLAALAAGAPRLRAA